MKYFLDTEFIEKPGSIQLISIGIVSDDGRTFYAENTSFDERDADEWVKQNVLSKLKWWGNANAKKGYCNSSAQHYDTNEEEYEVFGTISLIRDSLLDFFRHKDNPEFWGYYSDYDWVIFCWIFGKMINLPDGFPMYCKDLKQLLDDSDKSNLDEPEGEHNALVDALWNKKLYYYLNEKGE